MKKGGTILLLIITVAFVGFVAGMLVGRSVAKEPAAIHVSQEPSSSRTQSDSSQSATGSKERININTASARILDTLPGIGPVLAQRIVEYRQKHGPFEHTSDLSNVEGIGSEKLLAVLDFITVED